MKDDKKYMEFIEEGQEITDAISKILARKEGYRVVSIQAALAWWLAQVAVHSGSSKEDIVKTVVGYYDDLSSKNIK